MTKILIIEDDEDSSQLIRDIVGGEFQVVVAETGARGLELARGEDPDLILLDVHLPDGSGLQLAQRLRETKLRRAMRIVVVSGLRDASLPRRAAAAGADDFISKPFSPEQLLRAVHENLLDITG